MLPVAVGALDATVYGAVVVVVVLLPEDPALPVVAEAVPAPRAADGREAFLRVTAGTEHEGLGGRGGHAALEPAQALVHDVVGEPAHRPGGELEAPVGLIVYILQGGLRAVLDEPGVADLLRARFAEEDLEADAIELGVEPLTRQALAGQQGALDVGAVRRVVARREGGGVRGMAPIERSGVGARAAPHEPQAGDDPHEALHPSGAEGAPAGRDPHRSSRSRSRSVGGIGLEHHPRSCRGSENVPGSRPGVGSESKFSKRRRPQVARESKFSKGSGTSGRVRVAILQATSTSGRAVGPRSGPRDDPRSSPTPRTATQGDPRSRQISPTVAGGRPAVRS